jgi:uncharacterized protein (TIGR03067 family)
MRTTLLCLLALVWWVATPATPPAAAAPVPKVAKKADDLTLLEGRWEGVTCDSGSGPYACPDYWFEVKDGKLSTGIKASPGYVTRTLRLDPNATPKHIDVDDTLGGFHLGIYELDGDTIRWCESSSTTKRPTEFKAANGFNLIVYKRAKE